MIVKTFINSVNEKLWEAIGENDVEKVKSILEQGNVNIIIKRL